MNIRDTPIYSKHFAAGTEPDEHAKISIEYTIEVLNDMLREKKKTDRFLDDICIRKMKELRLLLK